MAEEQAYQGAVVRRPFATGSKSEHQAIMLDADEGCWVLRRRGGRAFGDPALEPLVGHRIVCKGRLAGYALIISTWRILE